MKGDSIADYDHVVRYIKPSGIGADGSINGSEFCLRPQRADDVGVSTNWLECFREESKSDQLRLVRRLCRLSIRAAGCFAELNVGRTRAYLAEELPTIGFIEDPLPPSGNFEADPSHSLIVGLPAGNTPEAELIGDMIAECITSKHPAVG